jgi:hypothetical protein
MINREFRTRSFGCFAKQRFGLVVKTSFSIVHAQIVDAEEGFGMIRGECGAARVEHLAE